MGKKKEEQEVAVPSDDEEEEDTPCIKKLKEIDDKFCSIEVELEREIEKLRNKYNERQAPLVEERRKVLSDTTGASETDVGTPAVPDFWLTAFENSGDLDELVHECDKKAIRFLDDIQRTYLDSQNHQKGMRFEFTFKKNPFFTNDMLWFEVYFDTEAYKPYKDLACIELKACDIEWTKNFTVEKKAKESAGKKGGKKKPAKAKEEPVPSFFSTLFTSIKKDDEMPACLVVMYQEDEDGPEDPSEDMTEMHLHNMGCVAECLSDEFLPYAVRFYTGEACEDDDDDDDEDEESEEEDDDDDDDDDESEEEPAPKKGGKKKPAGGKKDEPGQKTEECKQQ